MFKKVLAANDENWPKESNGKSEKARDAHQKKHVRGASRGRLHSRDRPKAKTTHVKQLDAEDESSDPGRTDSSSSDRDSPKLAASVVSRRTPQTGVFSVVPAAHSCRPSKQNFCASYG